jgi:hypothetical protein
MRLLLAMVPLVVFTVAAAQPLGKDAPSPRPSAAATTPDELFSRRAMRHARLLIQMRMLQLRDERLECVRAAILRRLPPELRPTGSLAPDVKQSGATSAKNSRGALPLESEDCGWDSMQPERQKPTD